MATQPARRPLAVLATTALALTGLTAVAPGAYASSVTTAAFSGGANTVTQGNTVFAKSGGALTVNVHEALAAAEVAWPVKYPATSTHSVSLLVVTVVFALPLGWLLTNQRVGRREVGGAGVIVFGLALFTIYGDPAGGKDNAPNGEWAIVIAVLSFSAPSCSCSAGTAASRGRRPCTGRWRASSSGCRPR